MRVWIGCSTGEVSGVVLVVLKIYRHPSFRFGRPTPHIRNFFGVRFPRNEILVRRDRRPAQLLVGRLNALRWPREAPERHRGPEEAAGGLFAKAGSGRLTNWKSKRSWCASTWRPLRFGRLWLLWFRGHPRAVGLCVGPTSKVGQYCPTVNPRCAATCFMGIVACLPTQALTAISRSMAAWCRGLVTLRSTPEPRLRVCTGSRPRCHLTRACA
jgi:hypothetical protein